MIYGWFLREWDWKITIKIRIKKGTVLLGDFLIVILILISSGLAESEFGAPG